MKTFKILGLLMSYPKAELLEHLDACEQVVADEDVLPAKQQRALKAFIQGMQGDDLYTRQEDYVATFDRGSHCSLHLFEHIYGESRDRGQAMVNLMEAYEEKGLYIDRAELPDFIPMFLEYLSLCPADEAIELLGEPIDVLATIGTRLKMRGSDYYVLFDALVSLSNVSVDKEKIAAVMEQGLEDESFDAIDKAWEDAAAFGDHVPDNQASCGQSATESVTRVNVSDVKVSDHKVTNTQTGEETMNGDDKSVHAVKSAGQKAVPQSISIN